MNYLSPKALVATAVFAVSFVLLSRAGGWISALFWVAVILAAAHFAIRGAPRVGDADVSRFTVSVPFYMGILGFVALFALVEKPALRWGIMALAVFVVFVALHTLYRSNVPETFRPRYLLPIMRMTLYGGVYGLFAATFGFMTFVQLPIWFGAIAILAIAGFSSWSLFRLAGVSNDHAYPATLVITLLTFELFWVITFLPVGYAVQGWLLGGSLYALVQGVMLRFHETGRLERRSRGRFIAAVVMILVVALAARWV